MLFYSFSALLHDHSLAVVQLRSQTNDRILAEGPFGESTYSTFGDDIA